MMDIFFGPLAIWFGIPAVVGTAFFTLRTALMLVGGDTDADVGADVDLGADAHLGPDYDVSMAVDLDVEAGEAGDSTAIFKMISIQAIAAFLMGFGWGGLGSFWGMGWSFPVSLLAAAVSGLGIMWVLGVMLRFVYGLQSSGTVELYHALEAEGSVYAQIPAAGAGAGEVRVVIGDRERYYKAISAGEALPTGAQIKVVSVNDDDNSVTVTEV